MNKQPQRLLTIVVASLCSTAILAAAPSTATKEHALWKKEHQVQMQEHAQWQKDHERVKAALEKLQSIVVEHEKELAEHESELASHGESIRQHEAFLAGTSEAADRKAFDAKHREFAQRHAGVQAQHRKWAARHNAVMDIVKRIEKLSTEKP